MDGGQEQTIKLTNNLSDAKSRIMVLEKELGIAEFKLSTLQGEVETQKEIASRGHALNAEISDLRDG